MRTLALDWGTVRIGAAVSDPDGKIAFPLDKFLDSKNGVDEIKKIVKELSVDQVLVGLPKGLNGQDTASTVAAKKFVSEIRANIIQPVELLDERFSSVAAGDMLSDQGIKEKDQRGMKDNIAAQMMLQQYLDTNYKL